MTQLIVAELGEYVTKYVLERQVYTTMFYSADPVEVAQDILDHLTRCRSPQFPVELLLKFGGTISDDVGVIVSSVEMLQ